MTACPEAMAAMAAMGAQSAVRAAGRRRQLSVPSASTYACPRVLTHRLMLEGLDECWLAPARALQERTDQPLPHDLTIDDFRVAEHPADGQWASRSSSAFEPIPSAGEPKWQSREIATGAVYNPIQPLLYGMAGGAGLSVLRMNTSERHRQLLSRHSPHELALAAVGLSLRLGTQPVRREHLLHSMQNNSAQPVHPPIPNEVTMVACLQDCTGGREGAMDLSHNVWASKAADLLEHVSCQLGPHIAQLLLEPHYEYSRAALQQAGSVDAKNVTSIFKITEHRAASRLRAIDPTFGVNWVDGTANPALTRTRILMNPAHVQVASSGTKGHADALEALQRATDGCHDAQQLRWDRLQLFTGDVLVADNTSLLLSTDPTQQCTGVRLHGQSTVSVYEEVDVLRSCAESKQAAARRKATGCSTDGSTRDGEFAKIHTSHALWVGLKIQHNPSLKWWWW